MNPFSALVSIGSSIAGAFFANKAEDKALEATRQGEQARIDYMKQALDAYEGNMDKVLAAGRDATGKAIDAQKQGAQGSKDTIMEMMQRGIDEFAPYREAGLEALGQLRKDATAPLGESPFYKFQQEQGRKAIDMAFAARSGFNSGAAVQAQYNFQQELGGREVAQRRSQLNKLADYGYNAGNQIAGLEQGAATNAANIDTGVNNNIADIYQQQGINEANVFGKLGQFQAGVLNNMGQVTQQSYLDQGQIRADKYNNYANIVSSAPTNVLSYDYLNDNNINLNPRNRKKTSTLTSSRNSGYSRLSDAGRYV